MPSVSVSEDSIEFSAISAAVALLKRVFLEVSVISSKSPAIPFASLAVTFRFNELSSPPATKLTEIPLYADLSVTVEAESFPSTLFTFGEVESEL